MPSTVRIHAIGDWLPQHVTTTWAAPGRRLVPEVERMIGAAWADARARRPGVQLFDGPMCRLERFEATAGALRLSLSRTSYKAFLGTNMTHPELADDPRRGPDVMANPLGLSCLLITSDRLLVLGRRSATVAYYPGRVHPFAGALEPGVGDAAPDVFDEVRRELAEELGFGPDDASMVRCVGLIEDARLLQPELVFAANTPRSRAEVDAGLDAAEHGATVAIEATPGAVGRAVVDPAMTPVAVGSLMLWGRRAFGGGWFDRVRTPSLVPDGPRP